MVQGFLALQEGPRGHRDMGMGMGTSLVPPATPGLQAPQAPCAVSFSGGTCSHFSLRLPQMIQIPTPTTLDCLPPSHAS